MSDKVMDYYAALRSIEDELKALDLLKTYPHQDTRAFEFTYAKYLLLRESTKLMDMLNDLGYEVETVNGDLTTMVMIHKKGMCDNEG